MKRLGRSSRYRHRSPPVKAQSEGCSVPFRGPGFPLLGHTPLSGPGAGPGLVGIEVALKPWGTGRARGKKGRHFVPNLRLFPTPAAPDHRPGQAAKGRFPHTTAATLTYSRPPGTNIGSLASRCVHTHTHTHSPSSDSLAPVLISLAPPPHPTSFQVPRAATKCESPVPAPSFSPRTSSDPVLTPLESTGPYPGSSALFPAPP